MPWPMNFRVVVTQTMQHSRDIHPRKPCYRSSPFLFHLDLSRLMVQRSIALQSRSTFLNPSIITELFEKTHFLLSRTLKIHLLSGLYVVQVINWRNEEDNWMNSYVFTDDRIFTIAERWKYLRCMTIKSSSKETSRFKMRPTGSLCKCVFFFFFFYEV